MSAEDELMEWTRDEAVAAMVEYWTKWVRGEGDPARAEVT